MGKRRGRGEGSIEELASGQWRAFLSAGLDGNRKRIRLSKTADTKREALDWLRARQAESAKGVLAIAGQMTVGDWLGRWLDLKRAKVEPETWNWYERRVRLHLAPTIGQIRIAKLDKLAVEKMHSDLTERGTSPSEQYKAATTLRAALAEAIQAGIISTNMAKRVKKPKVVRREMFCLDQSQARSLLAAVRGDRLECLYALALDTGMRPGEMFALHWPEVDLKAGTVYVRQTLEEISGIHRLKLPKTAKGRRKIPLAPRTVMALELHRKKMKAEKRDVATGVVFCDSKGGFLRLSNFHRASFHPARKRAGLPHFRPYDLRHTSATLLLSRDVNIRVVSERLGHESIEITLKHYGHCLPCMVSRAPQEMESLLGDWHDMDPKRKKKAKAKLTQAEEE